MRITEQHVGQPVVFTPDGSRGVLVSVSGGMGRYRMRGSRFATTDLTNLRLAAEYDDHEAAKRRARRMGM